MNFCPILVIFGLSWLIFDLSKKKSNFFSQSGREWAKKLSHAPFSLICYSGDACPLPTLQPDLLALIRQPSPSHHRGRHSGLVHRSTPRNMDDSGPVDQRTASMLNIHSVKVHKHTGRNMDPALIQCIGALLETRTPFLSSASGIPLEQGTWPLFRSAGPVHC